MATLRPATAVRLASLAVVAAALLVPSVTPAQELPQRYVVFEAFLRPT